MKHSSAPTMKDVALTLPNITDPFFSALAQRIYGSLAARQYKMILSLTSSISAPVFPAWPRTTSAGHEMRLPAAGRLDGALPRLLIPFISRRVAAPAFYLAVELRQIGVVST